MSSVVSGSRGAGSQSVYESEAAASMAGKTVRRARRGSISGGFVKPAASASVRKKNASNNIATKQPDVLFQEEILSKLDRHGDMLRNQFTTTAVDVVPHEWLDEVATLGTQYRFNTNKKSKLSSEAGTGLEAVGFQRPVKERAFSDAASEKHLSASAAEFEANLTFRPAITDHSRHLIETIKEREEYEDTAGVAKVWQVRRKEREEAAKAEFSFTPQISRKSQKLAAARDRELNNEYVGRKRTEQMHQLGSEYKKRREEARKRAYREERKTVCTFTPNIKKKASTDADHRPFMERAKAWEEARNESLQEKARIYNRERASYSKNSRENCTFRPHINELRLKRTNAQPRGLASFVERYNRARQEKEEANLVFARTGERYEHHERVISPEPFEFNQRDGEEFEAIKKLLERPVEYVPGEHEDDDRKFLEREATLERMQQSLRRTGSIVIDPLPLDDEEDYYVKHVERMVARENGVTSQPGSPTKKSPSKKKSSKSKKSGGNKSTRTANGNKSTSRHANGRDVNGRRRRSSTVSEKGTEATDAHWHDHDEDSSGSLTHRRPALPHNNATSVPVLHRAKSTNDVMPVSAFSMSDVPAETKPPANGARSARSRGGGSRSRSRSRASTARSRSRAQD